MMMINKKNSLNRKEVIKKAIFLIMMSLISSCSNFNYQLNKEYVLDRTIRTAPKDQRIMYLIMHYTAVDDEESLYLLTKTNRASTHYLIPKNIKSFLGKPMVYQLVDDEHRAWHAGKSIWGSVSNLNSSSLGIEIVNLGYRGDERKIKNWFKFDRAQINVLIPLAQNLIKKYNIKPNHVLAHSDIAPTRKKDPGPLFPWKRLASQGIGAWPDADKVKQYRALYKKYAEHTLPQDLKPGQFSLIQLQEALATYGYPIPVNGIYDEETQKSIIAFQMHFRPKNFQGIPDAETYAIILALNDKYIHFKK